MDVDLHVKEVAEQGYTIVNDAIAPELVDALNDALGRLERFLDVQPSPNSLRIFLSPRSLFHSSVPSMSYAYRPSESKNA